MALKSFSGAAMAWRDKEKKRGDMVGWFSIRRHPMGDPSLFNVPTLGLRLDAD